MIKTEKKIKKLVFLSGTRADFGKLKSLISKVAIDQKFEVSIFVTGMHMLEKFGYTHYEIDRSGFENVYKFVNQNTNDSMDQIIAKTIVGFGDYVKEYKPDLIIIHGDRLEALAGAIVGSMNNILTAHIEGGEISGTIDGMIRHAVTKLSHIHFCSNQQAKQRLLQLGENINSSFVIGSPDIDVMKSNNIPSTIVVKKHYGIHFKKFSIVVFHPVTTDLENIKQQTKILCNALIKSKLNYIIIFPNNDTGHEIIIEEYKIFTNNKDFIILPSMRFEYYLSLLKNCDFIIGNSSSGIVEAPYFGVPSINIGTRQYKRSLDNSILNIPIEANEIQKSIEKTKELKLMKKLNLHGNGNSASKFYAIIKKDDIWKIPIQKYFVDI